MMVFIKYGFFGSLGIQTALSDFHFALLVISTLSIAAGGNIINDIYDQNIDKINKPSKLIVGRKITEKSAYHWYIFTTAAGVFIGFYLANSVGKPNFAAIFIAIAALLYLYSSYVKGILLVGNILVSVLVSTSILIVGIFELLPAISEENRSVYAYAFSILMHYMAFAFLLNLIREIVKDIEDINGDKNGGLNTVPIAIGRDRATILVFSLGVISVMTIVGYMYVYLYHSQTVILYFLALIVAPLLYFCIKAWSAETKKEYAFLSLLLKIIMFLGMSSILLYPSVI